jgi:hypothetical protein
MRDLREAAAEFIDVWFDHITALEKEPLPYLDMLMEQRVEAKMDGNGNAALDLADMVPNLAPCAARQLFDMKFPEFAD